MILFVCGQTFTRCLLPCESPLPVVSMYTKINVVVSVVSHPEVCNARLPLEEHSCLKLVLVFLSIVFTSSMQQICFLPNSVVPNPPPPPPPHTHTLQQMPWSSYRIVIILQALHVFIPKYLVTFNFFQWVQAERIESRITILEPIEPPGYLLQCGGELEEGSTRRENYASIGRNHILWNKWCGG